MRVIRPGMEGDDIELWQLFLRGQGYHWLEVHGKYDHDVVTATKAWQKDNGLPDDGVIGPRSFGKAQELGFNPGFVDQEAGEIGPNWPPKPAFGPLDPVARKQLLGEFAFKPAPVERNPEAITITDDWATKHIEQIEIPQLAGLDGGPAGGKVRLHKVAVDPFRTFFERIDDAGLKPLVISFGGAWVARFIRGSRTRLSNHSYGSAIDINVPWNPLAATPALKGKKGSVRDLVPIANSCGLYWGGHFSRQDGMHFELAKPM